jgi:hypothetical protein
MSTDTGFTIYDRFDADERAINLLLARVDLLERELAEIKTVLRQPRGAVTRASPDGAVAIRDPNILAQEQATGTRGYAPFTDTE